MDRQSAVGLASYVAILGVAVGLFLSAVPVAQSSEEALLLVIDEDSIDNGNPPNFFSAADVNDDLAEIGLRLLLRFFEANNGTVITLYTGQIGDEGWFAPRSVPSSWDDAGPTPDGVRNYWVAGPGLGSPDANGDRESLLDPVPDVVALRTAGLSALVERTVCAVVYHSDVSVGHNPPSGNLKGANLGVVAFEVVRVYPRADGSSDSPLPWTS